MTIKEVYDFVTEKYPNIQFELSQDNFCGMAVIHQNERYTIKITVSISSTDPSDKQLNSELWPNGYMISFSYDTKNKHSGGSVGCKDLMELQKYIDREMDKFKMKNEEQISIFDFEEKP